ncbi:hypothetical protein D3C78_1807410 [compost metagenome]
MARRILLRGGSTQRIGCCGAPVALTTRFRLSSISTGAYRSLRISRVSPASCFLVSSFTRLSRRSIMRSRNTNTWAPATALSL